MHFLSFYLQVPSIEICSVWPLFRRFSQLYFPLDDVRRFRAYPAASCRHFHSNKAALVHLGRFDSLLLFQSQILAGPVSQNRLEYLLRSSRSSIPWISFPHSFIPSPKFLGSSLHQMEDFLVYYFYFVHRVILLPSVNIIYINQKKSLNRVPFYFYQWLHFLYVPFLDFCGIIIIGTEYLNMDIKQLTKIKEEGNELFKQKKFEQSIAKFNQSISVIEKGESKDFLSKQTQISKLYVICLINAALACVNLKTLEKYDQAINFCDKALSVDRDNIKGLYRRGLARKQKAEMVERQKGVHSPGLLEMYQKAKQDFEQLCIVDKTNELATKTLKLIINDIYRVTIGRGQQAFKSTSNKDQKKEEVNLQHEAHNQKARKRGDNMAKIMQQYKVEEVTGIVQEKVRSHYLVNELPTLRSQFQKAIRTLEKSQQTYIQFVYRINEEYLNKISPTFDLLGNLVSILIKKGSGEQARNAFLAIQKQKSFKLLCKSYNSANKEALRAKWKQLQLPEQSLAF